MSESKAIAGWYAVPGGMRYWDGSVWTEHFTSQGAGQPPSVARPSNPNKTMLLVVIAVVAVLAVVGGISSLHKSDQLGHDLDQTYCQEYPQDC